MALKNRSMYAILGILRLSPSTGYDIKMYSDKVLSGFWNENFGHIYPTLKMLLEDGMIRIVSGSESGRKVVYGITPKGEAELDLWLAEETLPQPVRSEFMLKLLFASSQPKPTVRRMLTEYREHHQASIAAYAKTQAALDTGIPSITEDRAVFIRAILRSAILSAEAAIRWCDETMQQMDL